MFTDQVLPELVVAYSLIIMELWNNNWIHENHRARNSSATRKDEVDILFPIFFHCVQLNTLGIIYKANRRKLWKAKQARDLNSKEWYGGKIPGFSFYLIYPMLDAEEANNPETTDKHKCIKKSFLFSEMTWKGTV